MTINGITFMYLDTFWYIDLSEEQAIQTSNKIRNSTKSLSQLCFILGSVNQYLKKALLRKL